MNHALEHLIKPEDDKPYQDDDLGRKSTQKSRSPQIISSSR